MLIRPFTVQYHLRTVVVHQVLDALAKDNSVRFEAILSQVNQEIREQARSVERLAKRKA